MKSELELMGVSLIGLAEKEDLIDALLRARRNVAGASSSPSSVLPMPASLRALAKQFEDADIKNEAHDIISESPDLSKDAESFFKRSFQWREDFTECYMRIGLRLQRGLLPRPNCYVENIAFHNIMKEILSDLDDDDDDRPWMHSVTRGIPKFSGDKNYSDIASRLECNDKNAMEMNCHPSKWFHAFNVENFNDHLTGVPSKEENAKSHHSLAPKRTRVSEIVFRFRHCAIQSTST
jgi:hypothetical protein